jgi:hypothetical protein
VAAPEGNERWQVGERIEQQILDALGEQPLNTSKHFDMVVLHTKNQLRLCGVPDQQEFRDAIFRLIADVERRWASEPSWHYAEGYRVRDFSDWPPLKSYMTEVQFHPGQTKWGNGINWVLPALHWDTFDDRTMTEPLMELVSAKVAKYTAHPMAAMCDEYVLLVYFNQGLMYNSPIKTPRRNVSMLVDEVRDRATSDHGLFSRAYLFLAPSPGEATFRLW